MVLFVSSFEIINVAVRKAKSKRSPDQNIFSWIAASVTDTAAVNPNDIKKI